MVTHSLDKVRNLPAWLKQWYANKFSIFLSSWITLIVNIIKEKNANKNASFRMIFFASWNHETIAVD